MYRNKESIVLVVLLVGVEIQTLIPRELTLRMVVGMDTGRGVEYGFIATPTDID